MSGTFLVFVVLSIGAVAFLVRFFIALCNESRSVQAYRVVRVGPAVYEIQSRRAAMNTVPPGSTNGNGTNGRRVSPISAHSSGWIAWSLRSRKDV